jgi:PST family polysaccharide transporter
MKKYSEEKNVFSNTVLLYVLQISGYLFPLITFPFLTRELGPEKYGVIVFSNAAMMYFQLLIDFGFLLSATKECSINRDDKRKLSEIVSRVIQAKLLLAILGFLILLLLVFTINAFSEKKVFILLSYIPILISVFIPDYLFRGIEKMSTLTFRTLIARAIYTLFILLLVKNPEDYIFIPILTALGNSLIVIVTWYFLVKKDRIIFEFTSIQKTYQTLKDSSQFFLSRIASTVYGASNIFLLGFFHSNVALAQFGAANTLNSSVRGMFNPIADSLFPYMIKKKNFKLIRTVLLVSLPIIIIGTIFLYIYAPEIIYILCGEQFDDAVLIFRSMLPMILLSLPIYLLGFPVLGAMNMMKEANLSVIFAAIYHLIGLAILLIIGKLDFINVAILTCTSEAFVLVLRLVYVFRGKRGKYLNENRN